jgi:D-glycero-D-manno-heptose 1,7-bisphosphate phosphatase
MIFPDKSWTLFLDRDGVINHRKPEAYVLTPDEFIFNRMAAESIAQLSNIFGRIIIVTNQQGIGKGLMSEDDLQEIHRKLLDKVNEEGGKIDKIYHCPELKEAGSFYRKPMPGMALKAKKEFPEIEFRKSVMVGDTISDMLFGKNLKMITVFIETDKRLISENHKLIDLAFKDLQEFAHFIDSVNKNG